MSRLGRRMLPPIRMRPSITRWRGGTWCRRCSATSLVTSSRFGDRKLAGVLPLFLVRAPLLGAKLIGLPYDIGSGGPLAGDGETEAALVRAAIELAEQQRVAYLELRLGESRESLDGLGMVRSHPVVISDMDLTAGDKVWSQVSTDNRQSIRKARNRGVKIREAVSLADCDAFYQVYLRAFRDFGTPPYGRSYFPTVWRRLGVSKGVRLLLAEVEGRIVGGLVLYCWGPNLVSKFAACLPEAAPLRAYAALYGAAIDLGLEAACATAQLGHFGDPSDGPH